MSIQFCAAFISLSLSVCPCFTFSLSLSLSFSQIFIPSFFSLSLFLFSLPLLISLTEVLCDSFNAYLLFFLSLHPLYLFLSLSGSLSASLFLSVCLFLFSLFQFSHCLPLLPTTAAALSRPAGGPAGFVVSSA